MKEEEVFESRLLDTQVAIELRNFNKAREILDELKDTQLPKNLRLDYLNFAGQAAIEVHEFESGRDKIQEALDLLKDDLTANPLQVERLRNWIGISFYRQHLYEKALEQFKLCREGILVGRITDQRFKFWVLSNLGNSQLALNNYSLALQTYNECLTMAKVGEDDQTRAAVYWGMGLAYRETYRLPEACRYLLRSAGIYERIGTTSLAATAKSLLGQALVDRHLFDKALEYLDQALKLSRSDDALTLTLIYVNRAYAYFELGQLAQAQESCETSLAYARKHQDKLLLGQSLAQLGRIYGELGKGAEALACFREAIGILNQTDYKAALSKIYKRYIELTKKLNLIEETLEALEIAYNL